MNRILAIALVITISVSAFAQEDDPVVSGFLKTQNLGMVKSSFDFTPEWQYVSSDLYLFNTEQFADVINAIITGKKIRWWRKNKYDLQNILITMQTKGLGQYDNITIPLFNFVLQKDPETGYKITAETNDVIRIVDNYPAPAINDFITAKVDVKVITKDNEVKIYKLAASQLETISMLVTNPSTAVMQLIGEFGKMIESVADQREFHFTSTIRIYDNDNFNQRLHSIVVFAFVPSSENEAKINIDDDLRKLQKLLQDTSVKVNRRFLYEHINIRKYPYVVIVNYKSKYIPDVPEDIDFDVLKSRETKLVSDYKRGVLRPEIYELEKELLDYLKLYAQLQLDLNNYFLNLQNRTTEDFSKFYYLIFRDYWNIKNSYKNILTVRANDQIFQGDFKKYYDKFMTKASLALDKNINLQNIKQLTDLLFYFENTPLSEIPADSASIEDYLKILNSVSFPESENNTPEIQLLNKWKNYLEQIYFDMNFRDDLLYLKSLPVNDETYQQVINYQVTHGNTQCQLCKEQLNEFVNTFMKKYKQYKLDQARKQFEQLRIKTKSDLIGITKKISCMRQYLHYYRGEKPEYLKLIEQDVVRLDDQRQTLLGILNRNYVFTSEDEIDKLMRDIQSLADKINQDVQTLCKQEEHLCDCKPVPIFPSQTDTLAKPTDSLKQTQDTVKQNIREPDKEGEKKEAEPKKD